MWSRLRTLFAGLFHRSRAESDMAEELAFHLRSRIDDLMADGLTSEAAARQARREFGGVEVHKDRCREALGWRVIDELRGDLLYTARALRRSPAFTVVAVLTLALAIGAATSVFSLLDALVLRPLPAPQPERLVEIALPAQNSIERGLSLPMFQQIRNSQTVFSDIFGWTGGGILDVEANGAQTRGDIWMVTGGFYRELGVRPYVGRLLDRDDVHLSQLSPARVAVLGYAFWRRHYGGSRAAIGREVRLADVPFTIIGVAPPGFRGTKLLDEPDITIPLSAVYLITHHTVDFMRAQRPLFIQTTARLRTGVSLAQARAQLTAMWPHVKSSTVPPTYAGRQRDAFLKLPLIVRSEATGTDWFLRPRFTTPLRVLLAIAMLVLLIASLNVAGLLLSRMTARQHEFSVRAALGSGRSRLVRQVLSEGVLLSAAGCTCAIPFAYWSARELSTFMIENFGLLVPSSLNVMPDTRVLAFAMIVAAITGLAISAVPAWYVTREKSVAVPHHRAGAARLAPGRSGKLLMTIQMALSLMLVANAGLLVRSLQALRAQDLGFNPDGLTSVALAANGDRYRGVDPTSYAPRLVDRIAALPGVRSAALAYTSIGTDDTRPVAIASAPVGSSDEVQAQFNSVSPGFFATVGVPIRTGRDFTWQDNGQSRKVAIISRSLSQHLFPHTSGVGRIVRLGTDPAGARIEVVGVAADARLGTPTRLDPFAIYIPQLQTGGLANWHDLLMRTGSTGPDSRVVDQAVQSLGHAHVLTMYTATHALGAALLQQRVSALLASFFGTLALLLAAIGLYGLVAYAVTLRTREFGIRLALGARLQSIVALVLSDGTRLLGAGLAIGLVGVFATTRLLRSMLYGIGPDDPLTIGMALLLLAAVALLACVLPAVRAGRVDPAVTLRVE